MNISLASLGGINVGGKKFLAGAACHGVVSKRCSPALVQYYESKPPVSPLETLQKIFLGK
ncbi:MAG: hypothetical protein WCH43_02880 [Verrucomicrobiota bacterium]